MGFWHSTSIARAAAASTHAACVARRGDIKCVDCFLAEHRVAVAIDLGDAELGRALLGMCGIRIAHRDETHPQA